jgi:hypothetical protein
MKTTSDKRVTAALLIAIRRLHAGVGTTSESGELLATTLEVLDCLQREGFVTLLANERVCDRRRVSLAFRRQRRGLADEAPPSASAEGGAIVLGWPVPQQRSTAPTTPRPKFSGPQSKGTGSMAAASADRRDRCLGRGELVGD